MHMHVSTLLVNTFNSHLTFPDQHIFMEIHPRDTYISKYCPSQTRTWPWNYHPRRRLNPTFSTAPISHQDQSASLLHSPLSLLHPTPPFALSTLPKQVGARATHPDLHLPSSVNLPLFHSHTPNINFFKPSSRRHLLLGVKIFLATTSSRRRYLLSAHLLSVNTISSASTSTNKPRRLPPFIYLVGFFPHTHPIPTPS